MEVTVTSCPTTSEGRLFLSEQAELAQNALVETERHETTTQSSDPPWARTAASRSPEALVKPRPGLPSPRETELTHTPDGPRGDHRALLGK